MREREIDLVDLIVEILLRWRIAVVAMLVGATLLGGFSYVNSLRTATTQQAQLEQQEKLLAEQKEQEALLSEEELKEWKNANRQQLEEKLTERQIYNVETTLMYERLYEDKLAYQKTSELMKVDPLNVPTAEITFLVESGDIERTYNIQKVYEDLLVSTGLWNHLQETCGVHSEVNELVALERSSYGQMQGCDTVRVSVMHSDAEICQAMAEAIIAYVDSQKDELIQSMGSHEISVVSNSFGSVMNTVVLSSQRSCESDVTNLRASVMNMKEAFTEEEWYYYNYLSEGKAVTNPDANEEETAEGVALGEDSVLSEPITVITPGVSMIYVIGGILLFAFIYVFIIFVMYLLNNKIRYVDNLQELYNIPQLGTVSMVKQKKKFLKVVDEWILKLRYCNQRRFTTEEAMNLAIVATKMAVKKQEVNNISLIGCNLIGEPLSVCEQIKEKLSEAGASVQILSNVLYDAEVMERLANVQGVVLVVTVGSTLYDEIARELELLNRQNIAVLGGIVIE